MDKKAGEDAAKRNSLFPGLATIRLPFHFAWHTFANTITLLKAGAYDNQNTNQTLVNFDVQIFVPMGKILLFVALDNRLDHGINRIVMAFPIVN